MGVIFSENCYNTIVGFLQKKENCDEIGREIDLTHYTAIVFISAFTMLIMIFGVQSNRFIPRLRKRYFQVLFGLLIITNIAEWLAASLDGGPMDTFTLHFVAKFAELTLTPLIPIVSIAALGGERNARLLAIPFVINVALQVASIFTGIVFSIDGGNIYHRGPWYMIYVATFALGFCFLMVHCVRFSHKYQFRNGIFMSLIMGLVIVAMTMQIVAPHLRLDWTCISFTAIMFYIYYDQLVQQVDDMTTLLNRMSYDSAVERIRRPADIIMFDVDRFKTVNDRYGHSFGDECLIAVSAEVKRVFGKVGYSFRIGGDEFCVIVTRAGVDIDALITKYIRQIVDLRRDDPRMPCVSMGYTHFDPAVETIDSAVKRADDMMYRYKRRHNDQGVDE